MSLVEKGRLRGLDTTFAEGEVRSTAGIQSPSQHLHCVSRARKQHSLTSKHLSAYPYSLSADQEYERLALDHPLGQQLVGSGGQPRSQQLFFI